MDHSSQFITLCTWANDLQKMWNCQHGDFYTSSEGSIESIIEGCFHPTEIKQGYVFKHEKSNLIKVSKCIWLPRLDQLMELAQSKGQRFEKTTQSFFDWNKEQYGFEGTLPKDLYNTLEQLWLGYVMLKKFNKIWAGQQWILV